MASRRVLTAAQAVSGGETYPLDLLRFYRPTVVGPRATLHRYSVPAERTLLGEYDPLTDTEIAWPGLGADEQVDLPYTKLYLDNARLNYFNKYIGLNGTAQVSATYPNRVRASSYIFKTANDSDRSGAFYDRDVAVGDVVVIRAVVSGETLVHETAVTGYLGDEVAAVIGAADGDDNNRTTQGSSINIDQVAGTPINDVEATAGGAYSSLDDGYVTRTYTITVTQSSSANDATTARLRVRSSDGLDDQDDVVPEAFGNPTPIGTKGAEVTFDVNPSASTASVYGLDEDDLLVGQQWTLVVAQAFTAPTATSSGTYSGTEDTTYLVRVTRGGLYGASPEVTVTTTTGYDSSGPTAVTASGTPIDIGSYGVRIAFNQTGIRTGDLYTVQVTATAEGDVRTLKLRDDAPEDLRGIEVDVRLFIEQNGVELAKFRTVPSTALNWSQDADAGVTLEGAIYLTDPSLTDAGDLVGVPLDSADVYVHYRAWSDEGVSVPVQVASRDAVEAALGTVTPDNPLAYAVDMALANTAGDLMAAPKGTAAQYSDPVWAVPVGAAPGDQASWDAAFEALEGEETAGQIVPLSTDAGVLAAAKAHVLAQSEDAVGHYRCLWTAVSAAQTYAVLDATTTDNDAVGLASVAATPATSPAEYTTLTMTSGNASFVTLGVRAGDVIRIGYGTDLAGDETYDTYEVESVTASTTLLLVAGPDAAINTPQRFEVWRTRTKSEYAAAITAAAVADFGDADGRCRVVWPDAVETADGSVAGYFGAAAAAGLAGSVPSHQGLRNVGLAGVTGTTRSNGFFTPGQLNTLGSGGVFVISSDVDGSVFVRSAVTPDTGSVNTGQEMVVRNADVVRHAILDQWTVLIGASNITTVTIDDMRSLLASLEAKLKSAAAVRNLGVPASRLALQSVEPVVGQPDAIQAVVLMTGPAPLNVIIMSLQLTTSAG